MSETALTVILLLTAVKIVIGLKNFKSLTFEDYTLELKAYSWLRIGLSASATIVGGGMFYAITEIGSEAPAAGLSLGFAYLIGLTLFGFLAPTIIQKYQDLNFLSILKKVYGKTFTFQYQIVNLIIYIFLTAAQIVAFVKCIKSFQFTFQISLTILFLTVALSYPVLGGFKKDVQTDSFQISVIFVAIMALILFQESNSIWIAASQLWNTNDSSRYSLTFIVGSLIFLIPSFFVRPDMWQRACAGKTRIHTSAGFLFAGLLSFFFFLVFTIFGVILKDTGFTSQNDLFFGLISLGDNEVLKAVVVASLLFAVLSSLDTTINNSSILAFNLLQDFYISSDHKTSLRRIRLISLFLTLVAIVLGFLIPDVVDLVVGAFSLILIYLPCILGLVSQKLADQKNLLIGTYSGLLSFTAFFIFGNPKTAFIPGVLASILVYLISLGFRFFISPRNKISNNP
ncbi:MAG: hypothetical protein NZO16_03890 [Deltaproteobacteria bacterium]|nr:hypothetical protein [Deltaproteobacteria bacterium]